MKTLRSTTALRAPLAAAVLLASAGAANAQRSDLTVLQWFENEWDNMERQGPSLFVAGYDALWIPPVHRASSTFSVGYDPFDRFDLGRPPLGDPGRNTAYGTEATFRAFVQEMHRADVKVYVDSVVNHNSQRTTSDFFLSQGGWPGFWIPREDPPRDKLPTDDWGDFNGGVPSGYLQSENPGGPRYDLVNGDLVALVDIAHQDNNMFVRHPVVEGDPDNIPAGTIWNRPDPGNAVKYPDLGLSPDLITNPGTSRNPGVQNLTRFPFNTADPMAGDAVIDNATGLLMRWSQWMMQELEIDGFRLDAQKHAPTWLWDNFIDSAIHMTRENPWGEMVNPFQFGENTTGNLDILFNYVRQDSFADRDSLDLSGAGDLRNLLNAGGFGSWGDITNHLDAADDGFRNGSVGVYHVFSHDNGSVGGGSSLPSIPSYRQMGLAQNAYILMLPGDAIVYHNGRAIPRSSGFFPREGVPVALGIDPFTGGLNDAIVGLNMARRQVGRGEFQPLGGSIADVLSFERRSPNGTPNALVAVNDRWDPGFTEVTLTTSYTPGVQLVEVTGNASNPDVDPNNEIPERLLVGAGGVVTVRVPTGTSSTGFEHGRGYVVYAEALAGGTFEVVDADGVIAADADGFPSSRRRTVDVPIVNDDSFTLRLDTVRDGLADFFVDDNALFRIGSGTQDFNGNGVIDNNTPGSELRGYEAFADLAQPLFSTGIGLYEQTIDATVLAEGFQYVSAISFTNRPSATDPIYKEWRLPVMIDRSPIEISIVQEGQTLDSANPELAVVAGDNTLNRVWVLGEVADGIDPTTLINFGTLGQPYDRREWRGIVGDSLDHGFRDVTVVAEETSGRLVAQTAEVFIDICRVDVDKNGTADFFDVLGYFSLFDAEDPEADYFQDGAFDFFDVLIFLQEFDAGC
ncbi:MAG: alpha-amylase family glycosyl hydrolase [Planctomycetota bacterium]